MKFLGLDVTVDLCLEHEKKKVKELYAIKKTLNEL
jgi:hypothetical protein